MKTPTTLPEWKSDVQDAYDNALRRFESGTLGLCSLTELFRSAAEIAAERRGIATEDQIERMTHHVVERVEHGIRLGDDLGEYKFNFVISYIHAHTPPEIINEFEADDIMEYVNTHWDLFNEHV